jgi:hypothetical protein
LRANAPGKKCVDFDARSRAPAHAAFDLLAHEIAALAAAIAAVHVDPGIGVRSEPEAAVARIELQRGAGLEFDAGLRRDHVFEGHVVARRPRTAEAEKAIEVFVGAVVRIVVSARVADEAAEARLAAQ